jgi:hypothetical protein
MMSSLGENIPVSFMICMLHRWRNNKLMQNLVSEHYWKKSLGLHTHRWEDNIKMILNKNRLWDCELIQGSVPWQVLDLYEIWSRTHSPPWWLTFICNLFHALGIYWKTH